MLSFILGLLKIVGILLLVLLILTLTILCLVLFVPIRYSGTGQITAKAKEADIKVTWLLHMIRFKLDYRYPGKPALSFHILWIDVLKYLQNKKNTKWDKTAKKTENKCVVNVSADTEVAEQSECNEDTEKIKKEQSEPGQDATSEKHKETFSEKIDKMIFKFKSIYDKIKNIIDNIDYYVSIIQEEDTKQLLKHAVDVLLKILKSIRPRRLQINGEFGFDTPDTTGKLYGLYCIAQPSLGEHVNLIPNFEESVLTSDICFKGKITIFILVINALRILFDRRLGALIKKLKNGGKHNV